MSDEGQRREPSAPTQFSDNRGVGIHWSFAVGLVVLAGLIALVAQNREDVTVSWLFWDVETSLAIVILVTAMAVLVLQGIGGLIWRSRKRRRLAAKEKLERRETAWPGAEN